MSRPPKRHIITITKSQWIALMTKTRSNAESLVDVIEKSIGTPTQIIRVGGNAYTKLAYFATLTHAIEEYGKLLYLKGLSPNASGNYEIEYDKGGRQNVSRGLFKDHDYKINLAISDLNSSLEVHKGIMDDNFDNKIMDTDTKIDWNARLNIYNTDIDLEGNPTNIYSTIDLDLLRQSIFDFKTHLLGFRIPS